ncbi:MAG TPA: hypothetical protein VIM53_00080 [Candidatus Saccharimonadales bacterium]
MTAEISAKERAALTVERLQRVAWLPVATEITDLPSLRRALVERDAAPAIGAAIVNHRVAANPPYRCNGLLAWVDHTRSMVHGKLHEGSVIEASWMHRSPLTEANARYTIRIPVIRSSADSTQFTLDEIDGLPPGSWSAEVDRPDEGPEPLAFYRNGSDEASNDPAAYLRIARGLAYDLAVSIGDEYGISGASLVPHDLSNINRELVAEHNS